MSLISKPNNFALPKIIGTINNKKGKFKIIRCDACNGKLKKEFNFCPTCGKKIDWKNAVDLEKIIYEGITF